ncbi:MAG: adenosine deaminase [Burkholderiales bacterium]|nr:adenosine deaminase [Opitutaceae bacterium]
MPSYTAEPEFARWVRALPKAETHLHIEGSTAPELLAEAFPERARAWSRAGGEPPFWYPDFRYKDFDAFEARYIADVMPYYTSAERYHEAAAAMFATCVAQGCRYVETSFHLPGLAFARLDGPEVLAALREAVPPGLEARFFGGMCHDDYAAHGALLEASLGWADLDGIDLHGPEYRPMEPWTADLWARARAAGKFTKAHAGEFMPAGYVAWVLDNLGVKRIEHGVRSVEDPELVRRLAAEGVALDVCPISNVKLAVAGVGRMGKHPIRRLFDAGVKVTISTDDTFFFGNRLEEEYYALAQDLGFTRAELVRVARHGIDVALLDPAEKAAIHAELDAVAATV